jgi:hypothetical protein
MRVALVLPPLSQLNTPYPSISYLARHLREQGVESTQRDLGIELFLQIFSRRGLESIFSRLEKLAEQGKLAEQSWRALAMRDRHLATIDGLMAFLQGRDRTLAPRILGGQGLPSGPRLDRADPSCFGPLSSDDLARHLATLYLEDLVDLVQQTLDPGMGMGHYQHHLALGPVHWGPLASRLSQDTLLDGWLDSLTDRVLENRPDLIGLSVPFPGMLYGALRIGQRARASGIPVLMGGGYISTELRDVDEPGLWSCTDALVYDDGEEPLMAWLEYLQGGADRRHRTRTAQGLLQMKPGKGFTSSAWYGDLELGHYLQVVDSTNPAHRLWSDGRWNKITLAHGCYWKRCAFCDIELDYISRYEPAHISSLVDQIEELIQTTGTRGFHLVDEAAPPRLLRDLALELLHRQIQITWWGNIRFERSFTPDLCQLLSAAGMVAITGGLEVASDRLLALMDKGITIEQAVRSCQAFQDAGILVHAYLMYGFPTQSIQESLDAMEVVRQFFAAGLLDSAFWHRFVLTRHSGVYAHPEHYRIQPQPTGDVFAANDIPHLDPEGTDPDELDGPLVRALAAWMSGHSTQQPVQSWFPPGFPESHEPPDRVESALVQGIPALKKDHQLVWLGGSVLESDRGLVLHHRGGETLLEGSNDVLQWAAEVVDAARPGEPLRLAQARKVFPGSDEEFETIWPVLRQSGLVGV